MYLTIRDGKATAIADQPAGDPSTTIELPKDLVGEITAQSLTNGTMEEFILVPIHDTTFKVHIPEISADALMSLYDTGLLTATKQWGALDIQLQLTGDLAMQTTVRSCDIQDLQERKQLDADIFDDWPLSAPATGQIRRPSILKIFQHLQSKSTLTVEFTIIRMSADEKKTDTDFLSPKVLTCGQLRNLPAETKARIREVMRGIQKTTGSGDSPYEKYIIITADIVPHITRYLSQ